MADSDDPLIGSRLRDYVLTRMLGQGAMGTVYLAKQDKTEVAIKFLSGEFATKEEFVKRFVNEAALSASLEHPNIVKVYEAGQEEGVHFMVMEYVEGVNLAHFLKTQDRVKEIQAKPWLRLAAEALRYSHSTGIIHRDIKPENIMVTKKGVIKIADLGLSKNIESNDLSVTMSGTVIGTPYYISPEQIRNAKHVDARTDMYSLGATFYHLVTGFPPFQGDSAAEVMSKHMNEPLINPQRRVLSLSDGFSDVLTHMMEKEPSQRFQNMDELIQALDRLEIGRSAIHQKLHLRKEGDLDTKVILKRKQVKKNLLWVGGALALLFLFLLVAPALKNKNSADTKLKANPITITPVTKPTETPPVVTTPSQPAPAPVVQTPASAPVQPTPPPPAVVEAPHPVVTPPPAPAQPIPTIPHVTKQKTEEEETNTIQIGSGDSMSGETGIKTTKLLYNWADLLAVCLVLLGIPTTRYLGTLWGSIRAVVFWVSVYVICTWFEPLTNWFHKDLSFPEGTSAVFGFTAVTIATFLPAWTITHRLRGHQKDTWQFKLDQAVAVIPSIIMGMALTVWIMSFLAITVPDSVPLDRSWIGGKIYQKFPSVQRGSQMFNDEKKK